MAFEPNQKYFCKVVSTSMVVSPEKQTPGICWDLDNQKNGPIQHIDWITSNTKDRIKKRLMDAGFKIEEIHQHGPEVLTKWINGRDVEIVMGEPVIRNGKTYSPEPAFLNFPWASRNAALPKLPVDSILLSLFSDTDNESPF